MAVNLSALGGAAAQFNDDNGTPLAGGKLYAYAAGTTTPQTTYTTSTGTTPHTNPIILDAAGRVPGGEIWLVSGLNYKFTLTSSTNTLVATWDNITGINGTGISTDAVNVSYTASGIGAVQTNVQQKLRSYISVTDFGAAGDGITDDTPAFIAAMTAANGRTIDGGGATYRVSAYITDASGAAGFNGTRWAYLYGAFSNMTLTGDNLLFSANATNVTFLNVSVRTFGQNLDWNNVRFFDGFQYAQYWYLDGGVYIRVNDNGQVITPNPATGSAWNNFKHVSGFAAVRINRGMGWVNANNWVGGQFASLKIEDIPTITSTPITKDAHNNVFFCADIGAFGPQVVDGGTSYIAWVDAAAGNPTVDLTVRDCYVDVAANLRGSVRLVGEQHMTAGGSFTNPDTKWTEARLSGHAEFSGPQITGIGQTVAFNLPVWAASTADVKTSLNYISTAPTVQALGTYSLVADATEPTGAAKVHKNTGGLFADVIFNGPATPFTLNILLKTSETSSGYYVSDGAGAAIGTFINKVQLNADWQFWSVYNPNGGQTKFSNTSSVAKTLVWSPSTSITVGRVAEFPAPQIIPAAPALVSTYDPWDNVGASLSQISGRRWGFTKSIPSGSTGFNLLTITVPQNKPGLELSVMAGAAPNVAYDLRSYGRALFGLGTPFAGGANYATQTFAKYITTAAAGGITDIGISRSGLIYTVTVDTSAYAGSPSFLHYVSVIATSPFNTDGIVVA